MEAKRTPLLETLVQNVARLCVQLVAAGPPAVLNNISDITPVGGMPGGRLIFNQVFHNCAGATAVENSELILMPSDQL